MSDFLRNIIRFAVFIIIQVYLLNKIPHLHQFIIPYIYFLFILWLPFTLSRVGLMFVAFLTGMALDFFTTTPGLHAAACVLIAYLRPFVIGVLTPKDISGFNRRTFTKSHGLDALPRICISAYSCPSWLYDFLEWLSFGSFLRFLIKVASTTVISVLLIIIVELLFPRRLKFRTNTA